MRAWKGVCFRHRMRLGRDIPVMRMSSELRCIFDANASGGRAVFEYKTRLYFWQNKREAFE